MPHSTALSDGHHGDVSQQQRQTQRTRMAPQEPLRTCRQFPSEPPRKEDKQHQTVLGEVIVGDEIIAFAQKHVVRQRRHEVKRHTRNQHNAKADR